MHPSNLTKAAVKIFNDKTEDWVYTENDLGDAAALPNMEIAAMIDPVFIENTPGLFPDPGKAIKELAEEY